MLLMGFSVLPIPNQVMRARCRSTSSHISTETRKLAPSQPLRRPFRSRYISEPLWTQGQYGFLLCALELLEDGNALLRDGLGARKKSRPPITTVAKISGSYARNTCSNWPRISKPLSSSGIYLKFLVPWTSFRRSIRRSSTTSKS